MNGIINIYKEKGFTSHDVVAKLRGILKMKKIGHTGTLDPDAEGVLPVCIGKATGLCEVFTDHDKVYDCEILLGYETDTEDITGEILHTMDMSGVTKKEVMEAAMSFIGDYRQVPPMYSAIKVDGRKLYELAREGKVIERAPRPVTVYEITELADGDDLHPEDGTFTMRMRIHCSKGTYIRSLCRDIGYRLGGYACMKSLVRVRMGRFELADSVTLEKLEELLKDVDKTDSAQMEEALSPVLMGFEDIFAGDLKAVVKEEQKRLLENGNPLKINDFTVDTADFARQVYEDSAFKNRWLCVYHPDRGLMGIYRRKENRTDQRLYPYKMFI